MPEYVKAFRKWLREGIEWRVPIIKERAARPMGFIHGRSGRLWRWLHFPFRWMLPYRRRRIEVFREGALGDVLMCTPGLRELKRLNPHCHITFHSQFGTLLRGLPYLDEVPEYHRESISPKVITFWYEDSLPPRRHLAEIMADHLGVGITDTRPDCVVDDRLVDRFRENWASLPRPWILVNRRSSGYTPNKDWFEERWDKLIQRLVTWGSVIEIGKKDLTDIERSPENHLDLRGRTTLDELVASIAASDLLISPISGPVHIAAAVDIPCVVIYGGYEKPTCSNYDGNVNIAVDMPCSPCFLNTPCPIDRECLKRISVAQVEAAVVRLWGQRTNIHDKVQDDMVGEGDQKLEASISRTSIGSAPENPE